jgi:7-cyano-7-deazaguanine synthase
MADNETALRTAVLLSGGQDSAALAALIAPALAITIDYGQVPAAGELTAATAIAKALGIPQVVVRVDCSSLGSGDLAGTTPSAFASASEWWPYRNQLLITVAGSAALNGGMECLAVASVATDSGHADGRAEFFLAMDRLMSLQEGGLRVVAPAIELRSAELIRRSGISMDVLAWTHSCHKANTACGACRGCTKHWEVLHELGVAAY